MRRMVLCGALMLAALPMDFACSSDEDEGGGTTGMGDGDDNIDLDDVLPMGGTDGGSDSSAPACSSFVGLSTCDQQGESADKVNVNLLLVIDKSGSMDDEGGFAESKWATMHAALEESLSEVKSEINVGLKLYPYPESELKGITELCGEVGNCCEMPTETAPNIAIGPGNDTVPLILDEFDKVRPGGGTPTSTALEHAYDYYVNGAGKDLKGRKFVVLATDGGPNCNDDITCDAAGCTFNIEERNGYTKDGDNGCVGSVAQQACLDDEASKDAIIRLHGAGIDTFVIGVPGSEFYEGFLDELAEEGGRPLEDSIRKHFQVDAAAGVQGLSNIFRSITRDLVTNCDIQLEEDPPALNEINVAVDCEVIPQTADDSAGAAGAGNDADKAWIVDTDTSPPTIRLQGGLCDRVREGVDRVDVVLGCPPVF